MGLAVDEAQPLGAAPLDVFGQAKGLGRKAHHAEARIVGPSEQQLHGVEEARLSVAVAAPDQDDVSLGRRLAEIDRVPAVVGEDVLQIDREQPHPASPFDLAGLAASTTSASFRRKAGRFP